MIHEQAKPIARADRAVWYPGLLHIVLVVVSAGALVAGALHPQFVMGAERFQKMPADWAPSPVMVVLCIAGVLALAVVPWRPIVGLLVYVPLAYAFPRVAYEFEFFLRWHVTEVIAGVTAYGYCVWLIHSGKKPAWAGRRLTWFVVALTLWIALTTVAAIIRGDYAPALNHHPVLMVNSLLLFVLAAECLTTVRHWSLLCFALALTLCMRGLLAPQWIRGNGDMGVLLAMSIPLTFLTVVISKPWPARGLASVAAVIQCALLYATVNRGGAVATVAGLVSVWLMCRWKLRWFLLISAAFCLVAIPLARTQYWHRFESIWKGGSGRGTVDSRLDLWQGGWRMALAYPIFGVGLGNFEHRVAAYTPRGRADSPHNNVVGMLAETGFAGAVMYLATFVGAIGLAVRTAGRSTDVRLRWIGMFLVASLVAYVVGGMFMTRHTMELAYLLAGAALAISNPLAQHVADPDHSEHLSQSI
ncbi:MAG: O-antigen ligase family protein [Pirellulaceae bacterium]